MDLASGWRISRILRETGAPLMHAHTAQAHALGLAAKCFAGGKLVVTRRVDFPLKSPLSRWKYRRADRIIAISTRIMEVLLQAGMDESRMSLIPSGVPLNHKERDVSGQTAIRVELGIPDGSQVIGTAAALAGHKDYPTLLRAFKIILAEQPDCFLLALGEGDERPRLESLVRELGLSSRVRFPGFRPDIADFWGLFCVYVQSSKMEGLCTSLIEAMHHRLPIAATRAGGIPDLITDGDTGLLTPTENPPALAEAVIKLLNEPELGKRLGKAAFMKSLAFSAEQMVEKTEAVYLEILKYISGR